MVSHHPATEGVADGDAGAVHAAVLRPAPPQDGEAILWEGRPTMRRRKMLELAGFLLFLALLMRIAFELIRPHFQRAAMNAEANPQAAIPFILTMFAGTLLIIALPVWLRSSARWRARYMLTNRRALVWLGNRIVGEARLFGAEMRTGAAEVSFVTPDLWLDWRLKDEGQDRIRFEQIADCLDVAAMAEEQGARWLNRPEG